MAQALKAGPSPRRRALFGLLDADGWGWASVKAFLWLIAIIFLLGYLPDRAYYFTVNRTIDLGIMAFSPVNFCPPENESLPCPAPQGAALPWHPSPPEVALPEPRTDGAAVQVGSRILYVGGTDGTTASNKVFVAAASGTGNFDKWTDGPALPEPRTDAGVAFLGGSIYVTGGFGADGKPTTTTYILTPDAQTGDLGTWKTADEAKLPLNLPEARGGASLVALPDGLLVVGGADANGTPTNTVWKSSLDSKGALGQWEPQPANLVLAVTDAVAVQNGDYVWVLGGTAADGKPVGAVQRGTIATPPASGGHTGTTGGTGASGSGSGSTQPGAAASTAAQVTQWGVRQVGNLPDARTNSVGWAANGVIYVLGGSDGSTPRSELWWALPAPGGGDLGDVIADWKHLSQIDFPPQGVEGGAPLVSGADVFVIGGEGTDGVRTASARANLAPQEPFFQLGFLGMTVPALTIEGEIGQQLGYLNASAVGGANFALLIVIGLLIAHRQRTGSWWNPVRTLRERRAHKA